MMAPKRVRMANSVSLTLKSENATKSRSPATTKNHGKRRELISALRPRACAFDRHPFGLLDGAAGGGFGGNLLLTLDALLEQLVDRQVDEVVPRMRVDDHLVGARQHALDRIG